MNYKHPRSKPLILIILSFTLLLFGFSALALEPQTESQQVAEGAIDVLEAEFTDIEGVQTTSLMSRSKELIDAGVPPGILVSVAKSVKTGHLSTERLTSLFTKDLYENIIEKDLPPGLVIKSIKTTYELPETGEPPFGLGENKGADQSKKPEDASTQGEKAETAAAKREEGNGDQGRRPEKAGPPDDIGKPEETGRPDDDGNDREVSAATRNSSRDKKPEDTGPPSHPGKPDKDDKPGKPDEDEDDNKDGKPPENPGKGKGKGK